MLGDDNPTTGIVALVFVVFLFGMILPGLAVSVRRLHDLNQSGWFYLLVLIPGLGALGLAIWFCFRGTQGDNRFGPDPLGGA